MIHQEPQDPDPALAISVSCDLHIRRYVRAVLSLPAIELGIELTAKDLLTNTDVSSEGRYRVDEHVKFAVEHGLVRSNAPIVALGMRNSLVNLRAPVIWNGQAHAVVGEHPESSLRPYYGLGVRDGALVLDRALGGSGPAAAWRDFFCAGVPVVWDDMSETELFDVMLCEAADHSHLFDLPRGHHHLAGEASRDAWSQLHRAFEHHLHSDLSIAAHAMHEVMAACTPPLRRCVNYFHAAIGVNATGGLVCLFAHAGLDELGLRLRALGCSRGLCVENSGSVTPTWFPAGMEAPGIPLVRAPNFRERGRAVLLIELDDQRFEALPATCLGSSQVRPGAG